ncbi:MAG: hypothetical protein KA248_03950 [Kiritimatiellae bacterium]|nr:hypothetical protein [Kiritimatiellia bacterium]
MHGAGALILLAALIILGLSLWGLVNRGRSLPCALAGAAVVPVAILLARYAWLESRSLPWAIGYSIGALLGLVSFFRQLKPRKPVTAGARHGRDGRVTFRTPPGASFSASNTSGLV